MIKDLRVASPVHRSFKLAFNFILTKMLVENVVEEFVGNRVIRLRFEDAFDALQNGHVLDCGLAKKNFAGQNVGFSESHSFGCNLNVTLLERGKTKKGCGLHDGQKVIHIQGQLLGKAIQVGLSAAIMQNFEQARDSSSTGMR